MNKPSSPSLHPDVVEQSLEGVKPNASHPATLQGHPAHPHAAAGHGAMAHGGTQPEGHPSQMPQIKMAIVDSNMLACMGLMHILKEIIPFATVQVYHAYDELLADDAESFAHFFVSARIYFEYTQYFRQRAYKTIVLSNGENLPPMPPGILTLNICRSEQELITDLLQLHAHGHGAGPHRPRQTGHAHGHAVSHPQGHGSTTTAQTEVPSLTVREIDVVRLLAKGFINKEIADQLNISLTTVITHRKNIMTKLHAHSLSDVIIYAVMNGHVDLGA